MTGDYFADTCEHLVATLSMLPKTLWREFDRTTLMTTRGVVHTRGQVVIDPSQPDAPTPSDLSRPVRMATIADLTDAAGYWGLSIHQATRTELRAGKPPFLSTHPHLVVTMATLFPYRGAREYARHFCGWHTRERLWMQWGPNIRCQADPEFHDRVALLVSVQFSQRYDWLASVRSGDGPRLTFSTDPSHARMLFKARDLPPGRERRAAIRHWVSEHYRGVDRPTPPIAVRSHFRGATTFDWSGLSCEIEPSEYDRDRVGALPQHAPKIRPK